MGDGSGDGARKSRCDGQAALSLALDGPSAVTDADLAEYRADG